MSSITPGGSDVITTQNLVPAGVATAGSAVELALNGMGGLSVQVTGTYTGPLSLQGTVNGSDWVTLGGFCLINVNTGVGASTIAAITGIWQADVTGFSRARITGLSAMTGTAVVSMMASPTPAVLNTTISSLPTLPSGGNTIGAVYLALGPSNGAGTTVTFDYFLSAAATTNANLILTGARRVLRGQLYNKSGAVKFVKLFNKATAPVVGTDTPTTIIAVPAGGVVNVADFVGQGGKHFSLGLGIAITGAWAPLDNTAVALDDVDVEIDYL